MLKRLLVLLLILTLMPFTLLAGAIIGSILGGMFIIGVADAMWEEGA